MLKLTALAASVTLACALMPSAVSAKEKAPPPAPSPQPDFKKVRETVEASLKANLFDPSSAQIVYTNGFQWGYAKPLIGKRTWGWIACGTLNAKNRMGGYVGASGFWVRSDANGTITWGEISSTMSTCDSGQKVDLQPELQDRATIAAAGDARIGVAEELSKLADLKGKGIISQEEFDAQKAKLLAR